MLPDECLLVYMVISRINYYGRVRIDWLDMLMDTGYHKNYENCENERTYI